MRDFFGYKIWINLCQTPPSLKYVSGAPGIYLYIWITSIQTSNFLHYKWQNSIKRTTGSSRKKLQNTKKVSVSKTLQNAWNGEFCTEYFDLVWIFLFPYLSVEYYNNIITVNHYTCKFVVVVLVIRLLLRIRPIQQLSVIFSEGCNVHLLIYYWCLVLIFRIEHQNLPSMSKRSM